MVTSDGGAEGAPDRNENAEVAPAAGAGSAEAAGAAAPAPAPAPLLLRKENPDEARPAKGEAAAADVGSSFFSFLSGELPAPLSSSPPNMTALFINCRGAIVNWTQPLSSKGE
jgi:hypothetical protein